MTEEVVFPGEVSELREETDTYWPLSMLQWETFQ
jgi:hypothetical protein